MLCGRAKGATAFIPAADNSKKVELKCCTTKRSKLCNSFGITLVPTRVWQEGKAMARLRTTYAGERRTAHFGFQLTPSERAELESRSEDRGMLLAEFVRACCLLNHG